MAGVAAIVLFFLYTFGSLDGVVRSISGAAVDADCKNAVPREGLVATTTTSEVPLTFTIKLLPENGLTAIETNISDAATGLAVGNAVYHLSVFSLSPEENPPNKLVHDFARQGPHKIPYKMAKPCDKDIVFTVARIDDKSYLLPGQQDEILFRQSSPVHAGFNLTSPYQGPVRLLPGNTLSNYGENTSFPPEDHGTVRDRYQTLTGIIKNNE